VTDQAELARRFQDPAAIKAMRYVMESLDAELRQRLPRTSRTST
jgi:predicted transcriptional regulator of viral defense system